MENMDWKSGLLNAMNDDTFVDFYLVGTDNVEVPCMKLLLAMQSPVFKAMFYGDYKERECDRKSLDYHSSIIQVVVKYCHSGIIDLSSILDESEMTTAEIVRLVALRDAGRYFHLDKVFVHSEKELGDTVFRKKDSGQFCSAVLAGLMARGEDSGAFWDALFQFAVEKPMDCFGRKGSDDDDSSSVKDRPHPRVLTRVLEKITDTFLLVQCLQAWSTYESHDAETAGTEKEALVAISKRIDLKQLSAFQLTQVKPCSFFPAEKLHEACLHHLCRSQPKENTSTYFTATKIYVTGAGVGSADGYYEQTLRQESFYTKDGEYGDIPCTYEICFEPQHPRWVISVIMKKGDTSKRSKIHLYQASPVSEGEVPFNDWKCSDGTAPAPIVATISCQRNIASSNNQSTRNSSGGIFGSTPPRASGFTFGAPAPAPSGFSFGAPSDPRSGFGFGGQF